MSFLGALCELAKKELERAEREHADDNRRLGDVSSFTQMPAEIIEEPKAAMEIQVVLKVEDKNARPLNVLGIEKIQLAHFWAGEGNDRYKKCRYLYREPTGPNVRWRYSPIYKLGNGSSNGKKELMGKKENWKDDSDSRFCKLHNSTLLAFEEPKEGMGVFQVFSKGSVARLMDALVKKNDEIIEMWTDKNRSYLIIFGLPSDDGRFLYPAESPVFLDYFRACLASRIRQVSVPVRNSRNKQTDASVNCGICHKETKSLVNLEEIFAFSTFDKKSFLPGLNKSESTMDKVFPICKNCFKLLSEGRNIIDSRFLDTKSIYGINIYTVPELIMGRDNLVRVGKKTQDFLKQGLQKEKFLSERVLECDDSLVYHFIFWEKNQAQERLLLMAEDVPPTRLRQLDALWKETARTTGLLKSKRSEEENLEEKATLWQAVNIIRMAMLELARKNEADANVLRDWLLDLLGGLLKGERVDVRRVKELIVSRLQGLCSNSDWVRDSSTISARRWNAIIDFLCRANESLSKDTN